MFRRSLALHYNFNLAYVYIQRSGAEQDSNFGPLLFLICIDVCDGFGINALLCVDDLKLKYSVFKILEDAIKLQSDICLDWYNDLF